MKDKKEVDEQYYSLIFNYAPIGILHFDTKGVIISCNEQFALIIGSPKENLINLNMLELPDKKIVSTLGKSLQGEIGYYEDIYHAVTSGKVIPVKATFAPLKDSHGNIAGGIGLVEDITESWNMKEELKNSECKYREIMELAVDAIMMGSRDGIIIEINRATESLTGYAGSEILGRNINFLFSKEEIRRSPFRYDLLLEGKAVRNERILTKKDGSQVLIEMNTKQMPNGNYQTIIRDITERRNLEEKIIEVQKMDSIGNLAGGIAHDFNNILGGLLGYTSLLLMDEEDREKKDTIKEMVDTILKARELTLKLLAFGRKGKHIIKAINLNASVRDVNIILARTLPDEITMELNLDNNLHTIDGDAIQINQVIMNLCINAKDAMPNGGIIKIETGNNRLYEEDFPEYNINEGEYVSLKISDTGMGMSEEVKKRIFEPFFTTKTIGEIKGTGLGLAVVYGIMKSHHGIIKVESEEGKGSVFSLFFPKGDREFIQNKKNNEPLKSGKGIILVIDDEISIRNMLNVTLKKLGYLVLLASNGVEGVNIFKKEYQRISLVILDMKMPVMNGKETYRILKKIDPDVKVVLSSGYSDNEEVQEILDLGVNQFLPKPYTIAELSNTLYHLIGNNPNNGS